MGKIGLMGGTFDPIHNGHLLLGKQALEEYHLNEIWYMPSGQPPHKNDHNVTPVEDRCAMVNLAIKEEPEFVFSDFEAIRHGNSYTAQTLHLLHEQYPEHEFYFIAGADSIYEIEGWYHPEEVLKQAVFLVAGRSYQKSCRSLEEQISYLTQKYGGKILVLHCEKMDISSASIRKKRQEGISIHSYVPAIVENYIETHKLYCNHKNEVE